jgi:uncharacterized protein (TIGR02594 family)
VILFQDKDNQMPIMLGSIGGIPQSKAAQKMSLDGTQVTTGQEIPSEETAKELGKTLDKSLNDALGSAVDLALDSVFGSELGGTIGNIIGSNSGNIINSVSSIANIEAKKTISDTNTQPTASIDKITTKTEITGADKEGTPTIIPRKVEPTRQALASDAQPPDGNPAAANKNTLESPIVVKPPVPAGKQTAQQQKCIEAIIKACNTVGLTSKYAKAAILGIAGGESAWLPVPEGYIYSTDRLIKVFPSVFRGKQDLAAKYSDGKVSREEFFKLIYSPENRGKAVGNKFPDDGAKFYGRGFVQITGRPNYVDIDRELKQLGVSASIVDNPDLLVKDINISALATAMFYKLRATRADQNSPDYFKAALKVTGNAVGDSYITKEKFYQYFLGEGVIPQSTNKTTVTETKVATKEEVKYLPPAKQAALTEERPEATVQGFQDPGGKYPLRELLDEPDTNRLARGIIKETAIEFKDSNRAIGVPVANNGTNEWSQPIAPFGGIYPYSKVYETESGHLMVFDDSPGHENISLYHRKGSFIDFDANGTAVHKIVGDGYVIMDRNGFITIEGQCNVHIGGSANILVEGSADIEVNGATNAVFHSDVDIGCASNVNWAIGGDFNLKVDGNYSTTVGGNRAVSIIGSSAKHATGGIKIDSGAGIALQSAEATTIKSAAAINMAMTGEFNIKADSAIKLQSTSTTNIKSAGMIKLDGAAISTQVGGAAPAVDVATFEKSPPLLIAAPTVIGAATRSFEPLQTPVRPSPQVIVKTEVLDQYNATVEDFKKNPQKYYSKEAEEAGVNPQRPPPPDVGESAQSLKSGADPADIPGFLAQQLALAKEGYWSETGMRDKSKSNNNIMAMWRDIGLESVARGLGDQTPWCMAFVNWVLKQCNYRYVQSARAYDIRDKPDRWKATKVSAPQPGDICVWNYSHVNFVYTVENGKCTFVGGNQGGGKVTNNNPTGGLVTISYPNGIPPNHKNIVGFYRPSKN